MLYANKVITETYYQKGYNNHIILEGGVGNGAMTYEPYDKMRDGTTVTTVTENQSYIDGVPNRQPDPPTLLAVSATNGQATIYFTPPEYKGVSPILYYIIKSKDGSINTTVTEPPAVIPGLSSGTSYEFTLFAVNSDGTSLASTSSEPTTVVGLPAAPTNVTGVLGTTTISGTVYASVTVSFTETPVSSNGGAPVTGYTIVSTPSFVDISGSSSGFGASSPIVVTGLSNGVTYTFRVVATNANGSSDPSAPSAGFTPAVVPDPPTGVTAVRGNGQAIVQFTPPFNNGGAAITGYTATTSPGSFTATGSSSPLTISGLTNGTAYTVTVVATNSKGNSAASDASNSVTPATVPNAPTIGTVTTIRRQATVPFTPPANTPPTNGGSSIVSYTVTSSSSFIPTPTILSTIGGSPPLTIVDLDFGTPYTFTVVATNGIGNSSPSAPSNTVTPANTGTLPSGPVVVSATPGFQSASVSFTEPPSDGGSTITSYTITSVPAGFTTTYTDPGGFPSGSFPILLTATGLTNGTIYTINVTSTNVNGTSTATISNQVIPGTPPPPNTLANVFTTVNTTTLSFTQPTYTDMPNITNYKYSLQGGVFTLLSPADRISPVTITGLTGVTTYSIRLVATNSVGDSVPSAPFSVTTYTTMNTRVFTSSGTWTAPSSGSNSPIQYLIVGGGGGGGGTYSKVTVLGDVPYLASAPDATSYWIVNNPSLAYNGYMMKGNTWPRPSIDNVQMSVLSVLNRTPNTIRPGNAGYQYNQWYAQSFIYRISTGFPNVANYWSNYTTEQCNNISGGSGGGAGGQVVFLTNFSFYTVTPGANYTITVGAGGAGGTATTTTETVGSPGGESSLYTTDATPVLIAAAAGGSGGGFSRGAAPANGFNKGGYGNKYGGFYGGQGGGGYFGLAQDAFALHNSGGRAAQGAFLPFVDNGTKTSDETLTKQYGKGGDGGVPNTPASGTTVANLGTGGIGTGATLNNFANGIAGGSGIVVIKWYSTP
jgi:hypothetical protein